MPGVENVGEVKCVNIIELVQPVKSVRVVQFVNIIENVQVVKSVIHKVI